MARKFREREQKRRSMKKRGKVWRNPRSSKKHAREEIKEEKRLTLPDGEQKKCPPRLKKKPSNPKKKEKRNHRFTNKGGKKNKIRPRSKKSVSRRKSIPGEKKVPSLCNEGGAPGPHGRMKLTNFFRKEDQSNKSGRKERTGICREVRLGPLGKRKRCFPGKGKTNLKGSWPTACKKVQPGGKISEGK